MVSLPLFFANQNSSAGITIEPLTTLEKVKLFRGISNLDTTQDSFITQVIPYVSSLIADNLNRPFFLASNPANPLVQFYNGNGTSQMVLRLWPVQSITEIRLNDEGYWGEVAGSFGTATLLTQGQDYALRLDGVDGSFSKSGIVYRINMVWDTQYARGPLMLAYYPTDGRGNIKVTYTYGFDKIPPDLEWVANMAVTRMMQTAQNGYPFKEEHYENYGYSLGNMNGGLLGGDLAQPLAKYRIIPFGEDSQF